MFHKAIPFQDGILTVGAERALLKHWTMSDGKWAQETLWERDEGEIQRLRDVEVGDVNHDGIEDLVIATHDVGVVAVLEPKRDGTEQTTNLMKSLIPLYEIEIGDIDGDGKLEFFASPSDRNQSKKSQAGKVVVSLMGKSISEASLKNTKKPMLRRSWCHRRGPNQNSSPFLKQSALERSSSNPLRFVNTLSSLMGHSPIKRRLRSKMSNVGSWYLETLITTVKQIWLPLDTILDSGSLVNLSLESGKRH